MKMVTKTRPKNGGEIVKDKANFNASVKMWASFYRVIALDIKKLVLDNRFNCR